MGIKPLKRIGIFSNKTARNRERKNVSPHYAIVTRMLLLFPHPGNPATTAS
jgi:hypothetical protein